MKLDTHGLKHLDGGSQGSNYITSQNYFDTKSTVMSYYNPSGELSADSYYSQTSMSLDANVLGRFTAHRITVFQAIQRIRLLFEVLGDTR